MNFLHPLDTKEAEETFTDLTVAAKATTIIIYDNIYI